MKKKILLLILAGVLSLGATIPAYAAGTYNGWEKSNGSWYYYENGKTVKGQMRTIGGKRYYFDWMGVMQTGVIGNGEDVYLADASGAICEGKGWKYYNLHYYYSGADGRLYRNQWVEGNYYVGEDGEMAVGTEDINGKTYYFDGSGYCRERFSEKFTGWKLVDGYWYYHDSYGKPVTGWVGGTYYVENGRMQTNKFIEYKGKTYYVRHDGMCVKNGWAQIPSESDTKSNWIYADADGSLSKNCWEVIDGSLYYFMDEKAVRGVLEIDGQTEKFTENCVWIGTRGKSWEFIAGDWYYFRPDNREVFNTAGEAFINGKTYYFKLGGALRRNEVHVDYTTNDICYLDNSGYSQHFYGWKQVNGIWYYSEANGKAPSGLKKIGGSYYLFNEGQMMTGICYVDEWDGYYFFGSSGAYKETVNGWVSDGPNWYYFVNGEAYGNKVCNIGGATYAFDYSGTMIRGAHDDFLFSTSGNLVRNAWVQSPYDGEKYYADAYGRFVYGERKIGGRTYWFDEDGRLIK